MRNRKKKDPFFGVSARVVTLISATLLLLSYFAIVVNPVKAWSLSIFGLFFIPIVLLNLITLIVALRKMSRSFLIPLLALLPSLVFVGKYYQFSSGAKEKDSGSVKILTYNVGHFALGQRTDFKGKEGQAASMDSVLRFIRKTDADIVCLQEMNLSGEYDVASFFEKKFPEYHSAYYMFVTNGGSYGNVTLTRFPIKKKGKFDFEKSSNLAIYTDMDINGSTLRVYNCHFESYNISVARLAKTFGRDSTVVKTTTEKMKKSIKRRPEQVDLVMSDIEECPVESVVTGDFNDNPMSYTYFRLMKSRKDAFVEAGKGFGATYSLLWPFIRIDYILYPKHYDAVSYKNPRLKYSDHYPVIAEINISDK